jgi:pimeloyl-ACP methyl ester carboxylesterase
LSAGTGFSLAQSYPDRVVRVITTPAGSGSDFAARLVSQALSRTFGQQIRHPQRVQTLASYAAVPGMKNSKTDRASWLAKIGSKGIAGFLRDTIADRIALDRVEPGFVDWFIEESARTDVDPLSRFVPMMVRIDLVPELGKIRCPMLVVVPGADPILSVDEYRLIERQVADCEFVVYEGMPHNITDEVPDRCAGELRRFLLKCRDRLGRCR